MKKVTLFIALLVSLSLTASLFAAESKVQQDVDLIFQSTPVVEPAPETELVFQSSEPPPLNLRFCPNRKWPRLKGLGVDMLSHWEILQFDLQSIIVG